ncbi:MobV family relaxase, partial [Staphylococcus sp. GDY8P97P]
MSYSILRVERVKGSGNTKGLQKHNQRENNNYNNKDIRHEDTHKNYDLIHEKNVDYNQLISDKIDSNYTGNRKIRKDAIRHVEGIITSDEKFFNRLSEEETHQFFKDSLDFAKQEYGEENILYATVHLDEKVPHMHFGFVPLTDDGRLSAKEKLGNKKAMTELQDRFN